jgi:hypothetical protein
MQNSTPQLLLASLVFTFGAFATQASAQIVNIDIQGKLFGITGPSGDGTTFSGQGALADLGNNFWNGVQFPGNGSVTETTPFTSGALNDSAGLATAITISSSEYYHYNEAAFGPPDAKFASGFGSLMADYLDGGGGGRSITFANLTPNGNYNLYLYGHYNATYTIGGTSLVKGNNNSPHSLTEGVDYLVFSNVLADGAGNLTVTYTSALAGLQLQSSPIPEPASAAALAGCALLGLAACRRRRSA